MADVEPKQDASDGSAKPDPSKRNQSTSLRRALDVLDFLAGPQTEVSGASLTELCEGTGLNKSTVLRLLSPLADARLARQDPRTRRWSLGPHTAYLGQMFLERQDLPSLGRPSLRQLSHVTNETAHLVTLEGSHVCYVDKVEATDASVRMISRIGALQPLHSTAVGKCFLAYGGDEIFERMVEAGMPARTERTITDPEQMRTELTWIRANGYSVDDVENEAHIRCIAAPIFQSDGQICAAVSVAGPTVRVSSERVGDLAGHVRAAADEVTRELGGVSEPSERKNTQRTSTGPEGPIDE